MFTLQQLECFCAAYRARNLHRAAEEAGISRQGLGKAVRALEAELGAPLFTGSRQGVEPTPLAEGIYPQASAIVGQAAALAEKAARLAGRGQARLVLRLGATFSAIETTDPLLPITFPEEHPRVDLQVDERPDAELARMVGQGRLDGALVIGPADADPAAGLAALCVHREGLVMIMSPDNPLARRPALTAADLDGAPLLLVSDQFKARDQLFDKLHAAGVEPRVEYSSADFSLLVRMSQMGMGLAPLPRSRLKLPEFGGMAAVPLDPSCDPGWQIDLLYRPDAGPAMGELLDYLREHRLAVQQ